MDYSNPSKEKTKSRQPVITAMTRMANPMLAEIIAKCGAESITIDNEHFPFTDKDIVNITRAIHGAGAEAMVRINQKDTGTIYRTLDMGVDGVLAPNIAGKNEAEQVIKACKYPPEGNRGCCPITRGADFGIGINLHEYYQKMNDKIQASMMVEDHQVIDELAEILNLAGIDHFAIGPSDFSGSYGRPGHASDDDIAKDIADAYARILSAGFAASGLAYTTEAAAKMLRENRTVFNIGSDLQMLTKSYADYVRLADDVVNSLGLKRNNKSLKCKLKDKDIAVVPFVRIAEPAIAEIAIMSGVDGIIIDLEHFAFSDDELINTIRAAHCRGGKAIVRIYDKSWASIGRILDMGADGIMVPQVKSYEEALHVVQSVKYPVSGQRGFCPITRGVNFGLDSTPAELVRTANKETIVGLMIETKEAYNEIDKILTLSEQIDFIAIGPSDLSASFGKPGMYDDPEVKAVIVDITNKVRSSKSSLMTVATTAEAMEKAIKSGTTMLCTGSDLQYMVWGFSSLINAMKKLINENKDA